MPATPRSNQNRRISSCSRRTSGWSQLRSGWSDANRCRYHSPGVPSGLVVRVHVGPEKGDGQAVGISSPSGPRPSRNQNRARSGEPGGEASAAWNHACSIGDVVGDDVDDGPDPDAPAASAISCSASASVPNAGSIAR